MKILIYGAGVQGSLLAHYLIKNPGNQVTILARGNRLKQLQHDGLVLKHILQLSIKTQQAVQTVASLQPEDSYDLIFVTMKYSDLDTIIPIVAQNKSQTIIFVGNNANPDATAKQVRHDANVPKEIAFGFQLSGGRRHEDLTTAIYGRAKMVISRPSADMTQKLNQAVAQTGYYFQYNDDMTGWLNNHIISALMIDAVAINQNPKDVGHNKVLVAHVVAGLLEGYAAAFPNATDHQKPKTVRFIQHWPTLTKRLLQGYYLSPLASEVAGTSAEITKLFESFPYVSENMTNWHQVKHYYFSHLTQDAG